VRQERISGIDFPMIVTAVGLEMKDGHIKDPVVAVSGASARTQVLGSAAEYLEGCSIRNVSHSELNKLVQREVELTDNIKAPVGVKRRFIESHVKGIVSEYKRAAR
jgi:CO/xanthine dehydrogenase FAD-binding subunit